MENPLNPVYRGGCMGGSLGVPIAVYDHDIDDGQPGQPVPIGTSGDLVATGAFPNIPIYLWNDGPSAPGPKYKSAYFERFHHVWAQGDFCQVHPKTGSINMQGRSDGVLNPSGIRFGSADIYAVLEKAFPQEIAESICVGQRRPQDLDESVVLFVLMKEKGSLTKSLLGQIRSAIAKGLTKRHVPKYIFEVPEIPVSFSMNTWDRSYVSLTTSVDDREWQKGGTARQENHLRQDGQAKRHAPQPRQPAVLLPVPED